MSESASKHCPRCSAVKPLSEFNRNRTRRDGHQAYCRTCDISIGRAYREAHADEEAARRKAYYAAHADEIMARQKAAKSADPERFRDNQRRYRNRPDKPEAANKARWKAKLRNAVFDRLGRKCACCGATENLTLDHVDGGGNEHRAEILGRETEAGYSFYAWLVREDFPAEPRLQVLCLSCNASKGGGDRCHLWHVSDSMQLINDILSR